MLRHCRYCWRKFPAIILLGWNIKTRWTTFLAHSTHFTNCFTSHLTVENLAVNTYKIMKVDVRYIPGCDTVIHWDYLARVVKRSKWNCLFYSEWHKQQLKYYPSTYKLCKNACMKHWNNEVMICTTAKTILFIKLVSESQTLNIYSKAKECLPIIYIHTAGRSIHLYIAHIHKLEV